MIVPGWRCAAIGAAADGTPLLFAAINHAGGPGWLARIPLGGGAATATVQAYAKVARAPLTAGRTRSERGSAKRSSGTVPAQESRDLASLETLKNSQALFQNLPSSKSTEI